MKQLSLKSSILLLPFMLLIGCNLSNSNDQNMTPYQQADLYRKKAELLKKNKQLDSALVYNYKALSALRKIEPGVDSIKDSAFRSEMVVTLCILSEILAEKKDTSNAIHIAMQDLKWIKHGQFPNIRIQDDGIIAVYLLMIANKYSANPEIHKNAYTKAKQYIALLGPAIDSLCPHDSSDGLTGSCNIAGYLYKKIGDTSRADFYTDKFRYRYQQKYGHFPEEENQ